VSHASGCTTPNKQRRNQKAWLDRLRLIDDVGIQDHRRGAIGYADGILVGLPIRLIGVSGPSVAPITVRGSAVAEFRVANRDSVLSERPSLRGYVPLNRDGSLALPREIDRVWTNLDLDRY